MNTTIDLIKNHTSIRKFNEQPVTKEEEQTIIECAMRGPSAGNMMQYTIIPIRNKETLAKLAESCDHQPFIATAGLALLFVADNYKWKRFFELREVTDHGEPYKGPKIPDFMLAIQDAMIAAQNSVLAAESLGLGTCYIGDIMEQAEFHRELFKLPSHTMPVTLIVMGHFDFKPQLRSRFDQQYVVSEEVYPNVDEPFIDGMFDKEEQKQENFAQKFYSRKIEADFFKEMIRSIKVYLGQWL
ncbi:MAG: nitroreductase family protein [Anaerolineaceae bacterium]|nr:nitroreductase family protein [Anaerolineaceae bacterium]